jgi:hypothetical protein
MQQRIVKLSFIYKYQLNIKSVNGIRKFPIMRINKIFGGKIIGDAF